MSPPFIGGLLPREVDLSTQGTVRTADSAATIVSQINASSAGDTVSIAAGSYAAITVTKSIGSGLIRVIPTSGVGTVTIDGVQFTSAQGIDFRGIDTTDDVRWDDCIRCRWRGGSAQVTDADTGFDIRGTTDDLIIEDVTVDDADVSFSFNASTDAGSPGQVTIQRVLSRDVAQDHVFLSRCQGPLVIQDFTFFGHTDTVEHSDGVQIVGGKNVTIRRGHIFNTRAFRDAAADRNDHGVLINYDDAETPNPRVPEGIVLENLLIHDQTSIGILIAGCRGLKVVNCTSYDNGESGGAAGLSTGPDSGNIIDDVEVINCVFNERSSSSTTYITDTHNFVADGSGPTGTSRLTGSPGFVSAGTQNYRLTAGSQLVDSGTSTGAPSDDIEGRTRAATDRGAFELPSPRLSLLGVA